VLDTAGTDVFAGQTPAEVRERRLTSSKVWAGVAYILPTRDFAPRRGRGAQGWT